MKKVIIHSKGLDRIKAGHPWIYRSQIEDMDPQIQPADPVKVYTDRNKWIGIGFYSPHSEICIRLLTRLEEEINTDFFERRIQKAIEWRKKYLGNVNALRWVNSESDDHPGFIVDEYNGFFVLQITSFGMEQRKTELAAVLEKLLRPKGIYERNDFPSREFEGLPLIQGRISGEAPPEFIEIEENRTRFWVSIVHGHKTGFYLDQRDNRALVAKFAQGKKILDCFSYTGGFAVSALVHGAQNVIVIEISQEALDLNQKNAELNQVQDRWQGQLGNGFDFLKALSSNGEKFDVIILDPPSFTKKRDSLDRALAGYKEINLRALKMLREGGLLVSASCSHHVQEDHLKKAITEAAADTKKSLRLVSLGTQAIDHPIIPGIPETQYLKCFFFEVNSLR